MVVRGSEYARQPREFYPTPPWVTETILSEIPLSKRLCDPCCGDGAMLRVFRRKGHKAFGCDIEPNIDGARTLDFLTAKFPFTCVDIVTNPPFGKQGLLAVKFIKRALELTEVWRGKVVMLLPVDFDSGSSRVGLFRDHPAFAGKITLLRRIKWFDEPVTCKPCGGSGQKDGERCAKCKGAGEAMVGPSNNHALYVWDWSRVDLKSNWPVSYGYAGLGLSIREPA